jgi:hypothetical protein
MASGTVMRIRESAQPFFVDSSAISFLANEHSDMADITQIASSLFQQPFHVCESESDLRRETLGQTTSRRVYSHDSGGEQHVSDSGTERNRHGMRNPF